MAKKKNKKKQQQTGDNAEVRMAESVRRVAEGHEAVRKADAPPAVQALADQAMREAGDAYLAIHSPGYARVQKEEADRAARWPAA